MFVNLPVYTPTDISKREKGLPSFISLFKGEVKELWLDTVPGWIHVTLTQTKGHKGCMLHQRSWRKLGTSLVGFEISFQTEGQYYDAKVVELFDKTKSLLTLHVDKKAHLLEVKWIQGGKSYSGSDVKKLVKLFIDHINPETAYLYDLAARADGLMLSRYYPFVFEDGERIGGPGYYGDIGFAPANTWHLVVKGNAEHCQSRDIYYSSLQQLRAYPLTKISELLSRVDIVLANEFTALSRWVFGEMWQNSTLYELMRVVYVADKESLKWLFQEVLKDRGDLSLNSNDSELRYFYQLINLLEFSCHQTYSSENRSISKRGRVEFTPNPLTTWEEEIQAHLPKKPRILA